MNDEKGFTLVEIMVTMVIVSAIIGVAFYAYNRLTSGVRTESSSVQGAMDKIVGMELFRLDIEHAGFGIGRDEECAPVRVIGSNVPSDPCDPDLEEALVLRATINNTNPDETIGWVAVQCEAGKTWSSPDVLIIDERKTAVDTLYFLDYRQKIAFLVNSSNNTCPKNGQYIGYPVDTSITSGCNDQRCIRVIYTLSSTQPLEQCASGTKNLLRKVGAGQGAPVLNCVADIKVRFGLDTDSDGAVDTIVNGTGLPADPDDIRAQLKYISLYALVQAGDYNPRYNFGNNVTVDSNVTLAFPSACTKCPNYHWRVIKKTIKFMDL